MAAPPGGTAEAIVLIVGNRLMNGWGWATAAPAVAANTAPATDAARHDRYAVGVLISHGRSAGGDGGGDRADRWESIDERLGLCYRRAGRGGQYGAGHGEPVNRLLVRICMTASLLRAALCAAAFGGSTKDAVCPPFLPKAHRLWHRAGSAPHAEAQAPGNHRVGQRPHAEA